MSPLLACLVISLIYPFLTPAYWRGLEADRRRLRYRTRSSPDGRWPR